MGDLISFKDAWGVAVARAWEDAEFRTLLLDDPLAAFASLGIGYDPPDRVQIVVIPAGTTKLSGGVTPEKDAVLTLILPDAPPDLKHGATELAVYLKRIDPPNNISCLC